MTERVKTGRVIIGLAATTYLAGLAAAPPAATFGGSCNGRLSTIGLDASHERGPVIIEGTASDDVIIGSRGDDVIHGNGGDDLICGGDGADDISGGTGDDTIFGERGDDTLRGDDGHDFVSGGKGNDSIAGGAGENRLYGDAGDDILNGSQGTGGKLNGGPGRNLCFLGSEQEVEDCRF